LDHRLKIVIDEITQNHSTKLRLPELASKGGLSIRRLEQLFVEETGMTYVAFRRQIRMRLAESLLCASKKSVKEISTALGYRATEFFCREFKKYHGCTAMAFRKRRSGTKHISFPRGEFEDWDERQA